LLCWLFPWRPPGWYGASSRPMAAFSGFWWSPGHAALGDALRIVSAHRHGHQNGPRWRYIRSPPLPISTAAIVAKDHVIPLKLTPSSNTKLEGFINLFISYWPLPMTMDAVLVTIVAGGRARIQLKI
jgi:hypothetical protein